jgi:hypothetical protein
MRFALLFFIVIYLLNITGKASRISPLCHGKVDIRTMLELECACYSGKILPVRMILPSLANNEITKGTCYRNLEDSALAARRHVPAGQAPKLRFRPAKSPR